LAGNPTFVKIPGSHNALSITGDDGCDSSINENTRQYLELDRFSHSSARGHLLEEKDMLFGAIGRGLHDKLLLSVADATGTFDSIWWELVRDVPEAQRLGYNCSKNQRFQSPIHEQNYPSAKDVVYEVLIRRNAGSAVRCVISPRTTHTTTHTKETVVQRLGEGYLSILYVQFGTLHNTVSKRLRASPLCLVYGS
jgi:hypothetical protein